MDEPAACQSEIVLSVGQSVRSKRWLLCLFLLITALHLYKLSAVALYFISWWSLIHFKGNPVAADLVEERS